MQLWQYCLLVTARLLYMMQLGIMFICNRNIALHVSDAFCVHLQENLETYDARKPKHKITLHVSDAF